MTAEERQAYIAAVVHAIHGKTPEEARLISADFDVIREWMDREFPGTDVRGVPLAWVLEGIQGMASRPASVRHARPAVEVEIERAQRAVPL